MAKQVACPLCPGKTRCAHTPNPKRRLVSEAESQIERRRAKRAGQLPKWWKARH